MQFRSAIVGCGRLAAIAGLAVLPLTFSSCGPGSKPGDKRLTTYPVKGTLFINDKPAPGVRVFLEADPPLPQPNETRGTSAPMGAVDDKGEYIVQTYASGDGAPAAKYNIKLTAPLPASGFSKGDRDEVDRLDGEYADAKKNAAADKQFTFEVKETDPKGPPQEIPAIKLTIEGFEPLPQPEGAENK